MDSLHDIFGEILCVTLFANTLLFATCNLVRSLYRRNIMANEFENSGQFPVESSEKFVSVHLAIHDEPADVVIATLTALSRLQYPGFEVIVIDNNTPCPATWQPVSDFCRANPRFRFFHFTGVVGAKAGALNIALDLMNPAADYVAVVDADYQVIPEFLQIAVAECEGHADQFVQFPQAYRDTAGAAAIERELGDYFAIYSSRASSVGAMLPTGTLSLICADTLRRVGGWPCSSVTEDAEIGMRMWRMGASGRYVDKVVGRGMLPLDLNGLRRQRYRWAAGNARTLLGHLSAGFAQWPRHGRWAVIAQLTAWIGFGAVPLVCLALALAAQMDVRPAGPVWLLVEYLASINLLAMLVTLVVAAFVRRRLETLPVKLALLWTSSFAWLPQLWRSATPFLRTPKTVTAMPFRISLDAGVSMFALVLAFGYVRLGHVFAGIVLAGSASTLIVAPFVDRALRQATKRQAAG